MEAAIRVEKVTHYFGMKGGEENTLLVIDGVSFEVPRGQFLAIVGPSGCGKTTILNMIAGLVRPTSGTVWRDGEPTLRPDRHVGYMFARAALMPWRTARKNIEIGLEFRGVPPREAGDVADRLLELVGLNNFANSYPGQLSQGMRQRVALARTLAIDPQFLLMDEPFAALDAQTKLVLQEEFVRIWEGTGKTVVFVTHDLAEAVALADRVLVFTARPGRVKSDFSIDIPRPRSIEEVRLGETFRELYERIWRDLRNEVARLTR